MDEKELERLNYLRGGASGNVSDVWRIQRFEDPERYSLFANDGTEVCNFPRNNDNRLADAEFVAEASHKFRDLVDEVRRLRALVKQAEWSGDGLVEGFVGCNYCSASYDHGGGADVAKHADCPAFTPDGTVR